MSNLRLRKIQAKRLWELGFGLDPAIQAKDFSSYLSGIPQIPESLVEDDTEFPLLSLCDPRPGLLRSCKLLCIRFEEFGYSNDDAEPFDQRFTPPTIPFWFRNDGGRRNRDRRPDHCRDEVADNVQVGSAMVGVFAYAHHPGIVVEDVFILDLPGTMNRDDYDLCACLKVSRGQTGLDLGGNVDLADPHCGTLRVRRK